MSGDPPPDPVCDPVEAAVAATCPGVTQQEIEACRLAKDLCVRLGCDDCGTPGGGGRSVVMDIVELSDEEIWEIYRKDVKKLIITLAKNIYDDSKADPQAGINLYRSTLINVMYGLLAASEFANNTDNAD